MLTTLQIKNFTIVESLTVDFEQGLIALTGETGAGKSILLDALSLLLGARVPTNVIRKGTDTCELLAQFEISKNPNVKAWLTHQELEHDDELIIRRVLSTSGRHKSYINGLLFPLSKIKELGETLIHIHGQHQQYHLLRSDVQREQLDAYAELTPLLETLKELYKTYQDKHHELKNLQESLTHADKRELLQYQINELNELNLQENEFESLNLRHKTLAKSSELKELTQKAMSDLEGEASMSLCAQLTQLLTTLENLPEENKAIGNTKELINSALIQCEEASRELADFFNSLETDPETAVELEARIDSIYSLARKHQVQAANLYQHHVTLLDAWGDLENAQQKINQLEDEIKQSLTTCEKSAQTLSHSRKKAAKKLEQALTALIKTLGMPEGKFSVQFSPLDELKAHGQDKVDYFVAPNPGQGSEALAKIASGGELSRISLAIQVLTAEKKAYPTLIFDEVDTGIGGKTAATVGKLLRQLGNHTQVFCITHQAQVAAYADHHYQVSKTNKNNQTYSTIKKLSSENQVKEIARMISGQTITKQTLLHAKELISDKT